MARFGRLFLVLSLLTASTAVASHSLTPPSAEESDTAVSPASPPPNFDVWTVGDPHSHAVGDASLVDVELVGPGRNIMCGDPPEEWLDRTTREALATEQVCAEFLVEAIGGKAAENGLDWVIFTEHVTWLGMVNWDWWDAAQARRQWNIVKAEADEQSSELGIAMLIGQEVGTAPPVTTNGHFGMYSGHFLPHDQFVKNEDRFVADMRSVGGWGVINHPNSNDSKNGSTWHCWFDNDHMALFWPCSNPAVRYQDVVRGVELLSGHQLATWRTLDEVEALLSSGATLSFIGSGDTHTSSRNKAWRKPGDFESATDGVGLRSRTWTNTGELEIGDGFDSSSPSDPVRAAIYRGATVATSGPLVIPRVGAALPGDTAFVEQGSSLEVEIFRDESADPERLWGDSDPSVIRVVAGPRYRDECLDGPTSECLAAVTVRDYYGDEHDFGGDRVTVPFDLDVTEEMWLRVEVHWDERNSRAGGDHLPDRDFRSDSRGETLRYDYTTYASPIYLRPTVSLEDPATTSAVMMVLDISGSMEGEKLASAQRATIEHLQGLEADTIVGVRAYPSSGALDGDGCSVGRLVVPLGEPDPTAASLLIRSLTADGGTPTAAALRAAVADLEQLGAGSATIVLVSDGDSNCPTEGIACDVAAELHAASGVEIRIPTVGFQIAEKGEAELRCIADATRALYVEADDGDQLIERAVEFSQPRLEATVSPPVVVDPAAPAQVSADVTSIGGTTARDVRLELIVEADGVEVATGSTRRVGNLVPGESREVEWTVDLPPAVDDYRFSVVAVGDNTSSESAIGSDDRRLTASGVATVDDLGGPLAGSRRVVLLGDSLMAGEGASDDDEPGVCARSSLGYGVGLWDEPLNLACAGATLADFHHAPDGYGDLAPQLELLRDATTAQVPDVVLLSAGAADVGLHALYERCLVVVSCHSDLVVAECAVADGCEAEAVGSLDELAHRLEGFAAELLTTLRAVDGVVNDPRTDGPEVPIVVTAYPKLLPENLVGRGRCAEVLEPAEMAMLSTATELVNATLAAAVERLAADGIPAYFVAETEAAFLPARTLCDSDGFVTGLAELSTSDPGALGDVLVTGSTSGLRRPDADGYRALTNALVEWSRRADLVDTDADRERPVIDLDDADEPKAIDTGADELSLLAGSSYRFPVDGFAPGTSVAVRLGSTAILVGSAITDADGRAEVIVRVPETFVAGESELAAHGVGPDLGRRSVVTPVDVTTDSSPVPWIFVGLGAVGVVLGGVFLVLRRS